MIAILICQSGAEKVSIFSESAVFERFKRLYSLYTLFLVFLSFIFYSLCLALAALLCDSGLTYSNRVKSSQ